MIMLVISSALCLIGSGALWETAVIDAPAGGMMIVASMVLCATGVFLFGIIVGRMAGFAL